MAILEAGVDDAIAILALPGLAAPYRRRERVIRSCPNRGSTFRLPADYRPTTGRLLGAGLLKRHERWTTGPLPG